MTLLWYRPLNCDLLQVSMDLPHYTLCCTALQKYLSSIMRRMSLFDCDPSAQPHVIATFHALQPDALLGVQAWNGCLQLLTGLA